MEISLLLPTRERPLQAEAFLQSVAETAENLSHIEVVAAIDDDDKKSHTLLSPHPDLKLIKVIGPQTTMGGLNSRCLEKASGKIIMLVNDDILIRSKGWDRHLIEADRTCSDGIYLMHTRDGQKDNAFPIFPILSSRGCSLIKDPYPKEFCGDCIDSHLFDIFLRLKDVGHDRILYIPEVLFEHIHFSVGKAPIDKIYAARSRLKGNHTFYSLWEKREHAAHTLATEIEGTTVLKPLPKNSPKKQGSYSILLTSFLRSHQSFIFRLKYLTYHTLRETYLRFRLDKIKQKALTFSKRIKKMSRSIN